MKQIYVPCIDCLVSLSEYPVVAELWQELASFACHSDPFVGVYDELTERTHKAFEHDLRILERFRFLVSHEIPEEGWLIKMLGFTEGSQIICVHHHPKY